MSKKKNFVPAALKVLIALSSFTGTVGLWNSLANKDFNVANASNEQINPQPDLSALPAIPTLVPLVVVNESLMTSQQSQPQPYATQEVRSVTAPIQSPAPLTISSSSPAVIQPATVTKTKSSKKR